MNIESNRAHHSAKSTSGIDHRSGKKGGVSDSLASNGGGGFSALMGALSAADDTGEAMLSPGIAQQVDDQKWPLAQVAQAQEAIESIVTVPTLTMVPAAGLVSESSSDATGAVPGLSTTAVVSNPVTVALTGKTLGQPVPIGNASYKENMPLAHTGVAQAAIDVIAGTPILPVPVAPQVAVGAPAGESSQAGGSSRIGTRGASMDAALAQPNSPIVARGASLPVDTQVADPSAQRQVDALLEGRPGHQTKSQGASHASGDVRDVKTPLTALQVARADAANQVLAGATTSLVMPSLVERQANKNPTNQSGAGFEGALGALMTPRTGMDATYEIAPAVAVVPESQVAETVSYWVTQGVQSAELTLDGFGGEPVEVRISLNGDQAQIDFRTDQADVRQVLEGASAQLKTLLSGEGLQLVGVSVGASGQGGAQGGGQSHREGARQASVRPAEPATEANTRVVNPSVGQSVDMFV